jgi:Xaa-Pro aminopeptidase
MPMPTALRTDRLARLRERLSAAGLDAAVLAKPQNVVYLSGFTGSAGLAVITERGATLVVDFRYVEQAAAQAPAFDRVQAGGPLVETAAEVLRRLDARRAGVEEEFLPVGTFRKLAASAAPVEVVPVEGLDRIRWTKDPDEIEAIRRAQRVAEAAFGDILPLIRPGAVERDIAVALEERLRRRGAQRLPFDVIVASGPRAALPHGIAGDRIIGRGECVTVDFGAVVDGYCSDCTRTLVTAPASAQHREVYALVLAAQQAALAGLRAGLTGREADALAREVIAAAGHGDAFGHSLGHGVGLAVHEGPTLSPREDAVLTAGAVVTVEPGVYLPGWGGVRIEDLAVITRDGCENLTALPKDLIEVRG